MIKNSVYSVFDKVSDTFLVTFLCTNDKVAKRSFKKFVEGNKLLYSDVGLFKVCSVNVPLTSDDLEKLEEISDESFVDPESPQLEIFDSKK